MGGRTFEIKAPFATTSFKKGGGGGRIFEGGLIFGRLRYSYNQRETLAKVSHYCNLIGQLQVA